MSNVPKPKERVTLSKLAKIRAAQYIDPHQRGAYIRSQLDAENTAFLAKFSKPSNRNNNDSN